MRLPRHTALAVLALVVLGAAPAAAPASGGAIHRIHGAPLASGATAFHLGRVRVRTIVGAHLRLASGRRVALRLRRVRAGTGRSVVRLRLPRGMRRPDLVIRTDRRPPTRPRRLAVTPGDGRLRLSWRRARDRHLRGYRILRDGRPVARTRGATSKTIAGLANGRTYTVAVVAIDAAGNASPASAPVSATPEPAPVQPAAISGATAQGDVPEKAAPPAAPPATAEHPSADPAPVVCDLWAATSGSDAAAGTSTAPFASAQRLLDALEPGRTGCLRGGRYRQYELRAHHGGAPGAPIVLASAPGERATIVVDTDIYLPEGITDVTVRDLGLTNDPTSGVTQAVMIQDFGDRSVWEGNDVDGNADAHCMELGWAGHATARDTLIRRNRFHDCGDPAHGNQDHGIYVAQSVGATITENVFWNAAAYGIHLYPSADRTLVTHNVIAGSGYGGVIFASDQDPGTGRTSDDNTVAFNVIADGARYGLDVFWGASGQGTGNAAHDNCIAGNAAGALAGSMPGVALSGNVAGDVAFADAPAHDYRLAPGDPCLAVVGFDAAALLSAG